MERVSRVEEILRRDPAGVYPRMDFASRDRYRHAVEDIAEPTGEAQVRVALRAVESARLAAAEQGAGERVAHVGHHLIGAGRRGLEIDVAYRPDLGERLHRWIFAHPTAAYLGAIGLLSGGGVFAAYAYAVAAGGGLGMAALAALLALVPASELAVLLVQRIVAALVPPRRLPRLEWSGGIPEAAQTLVVVPVLLGSVEEVERLLAHLEVQALGNLDPRIHFAVLSDFKDAPTLSVAGDAEILSAAVAGIEAAQPPPRTPGKRPVLPLPPRSPMEPEAGRFHGMGAQAGQARAAQPPLAVGHRQRLLGGGRGPLDPAGGALRAHPRRRYPTAAGRGENPHRHPRAPAQSAGGRRRAGQGHPGVRPPPAARQRRPGERRRVALCAGVRRAHRGRSLHHGGLGHLPGPVRRGQLHRQRAVRRRRLPGDGRLAGAGERAAVPRSLRGPARPHRVGLRRRAGRRLPRQRPGARAAATPLGARRLADPRLALPAGADAPGPGQEPPAADQSVEDPRQSPAQPGGARAPHPLRRRLDRAAGKAPGVDPRRSRGGRVSARRLPRADPAAAVGARAGARPSARPGGGSRHRRGAGPVDPRVSAVSGLGDGARHRPDAGPRRLHPAAHARVGDGGEPDRAGRGSDARRGPSFLRRDGRQPDRGAGALRPGPCRASRCPAPGSAAARHVVGGARLRLLAQPLDGAAPAAAVGAGPGPAARGGAPDLGVLRGPRRPGGSLAATRQRAGGSRAQGGPPDLADQPRAGSAVGARRPRPGSSGGGGDGRETRPHADHDREPGTSPGTPVELVRHADPRAAAASLRVDGGQRQPRGGAGGVGSRVPAAGCLATGPRATPVRRRRARAGPGQRHEFRLSLRPPAPALRHRLPAGRRRRAGTAGPRLLRPAGLGVALGQFLRDRQGRRAPEPLVPPRTAGGQRQGRADAGLLERDDVRVPDAAAADADLPGDPARPELPHGDRPADPLRPRAARAVGNLGVRLRSRRPARQLPVQGVRRPGPGAQAGPGRRARRRPLRHRPGRSPGAGRRGGEPAPAGGSGGGGTLRVLRRHRLHAAQAGRQRRLRAAAIQPRRGGQDPPGAPPGDDAGCHRQRPARRRDGRAGSMPTGASRPPSSSCRSGSRARRG